MHDHLFEQNILQRICMIDDDTQTYEFTIALIHMMISYSGITRIVP